MLNCKWKEMNIIRKTKTTIRNAVRKLGFDIVNYNDPAIHFHNNHYLRNNARRLEHLASLRIEVAGMSVLEVGAGIGDHSHYYIDRGCRITITEVRPENIQYLKNRYPDCNVQSLDMERPSHVNGSPFDIVHCYGLLYHLSNPEQALAFLSKNTRRMLFLETFVSSCESEEINTISEEQSNPTQAYSGTGCRPTREWVFHQLQKHFKFVYLPKTQPNHQEFPLNWTVSEQNPSVIKRAVFIASREHLENRMLTPSLIMKQKRHE